MEVFLLQFFVIDYEAVDSIINLRLKLGSGRSFNGERRRSSMCLPLNEFADRVRMFYFPFVVFSFFSIAVGLFILSSKCVVCYFNHLSMRIDEE